MKNMSSFLVFWSTFSILAISFASPVISAKEFKVGDAQGWRQPSANQTDMYNQWISRKKLHVGDSVRFEYKNDSVLVVDKWGYYHCNTSNPSSVFDDGNTTITLGNPGPVYFVSGDPQHCKDGQRLLIDVIPLHPTMASSPGPSPFSSSGASACITMASVVAIACATLLPVVWLLA